MFKMLLATLLVWILFIATIQIARTVTKSQAWSLLKTASVGLIAASLTTIFFTTIVYLF